MTYCSDPTAAHHNIISNTKAGAPRDRHQSIVATSTQRLMPADMYYSCMYVLVQRFGDQSVNTEMSLALAAESMILVRTVEQQHHLIRSLQAQVSNLERAHHKALALHQAEKSAWQDREAQMRLTNSALCIELEGFQRTSFGARSSCASSAPEDENV